MSLNPEQLNRLRQMARTITIVDKFSLDKSVPHTFEGTTLTKETFFARVKPAIYLDTAFKTITIGGQPYMVRELTTALKTKEGDSWEFLLDPKSPLLEETPFGGGKWSNEARYATHLFKTLMELADVVCRFRDPAFAEALGRAVERLLETKAYRKDIFEVDKLADGEVIDLTRENLEQAQALVDCLLAPESDLETAIKALAEATRGTQAFSDRKKVAQFVRKLRADLVDEATTKLFAATPGELKDLEIIGLSKRPDRGLVSHYKLFREHSDKLHGMIRFPLVSTACCYYYFTKFCKDGDVIATDRRTGAKALHELGVMNQDALSTGASKQRLREEQKTRNEAGAAQRRATKQGLNEAKKSLYELLEPLMREFATLWDERAIPNSVIGQGDLFGKNLKRFCRMALRVDPELKSILENHGTFIKQHAYKLSNAQRTVSIRWQDAEKQHEEYDAERAVGDFVKDLPAGIKEWFESPEAKETLSKATSKDFGLLVERIIGQRAQARLDELLAAKGKELDGKKTNYENLYRLRSGSSLASTEDDKNLGRPAPIVMPGLASTGLEKAAAAGGALGAVKASRTLAFELSAANALSDQPPGTKVQIFGSADSVGAAPLATAQVFAAKDAPTKSLVIEGTPTGDLPAEAVATIPEKDETLPMKSACNDWEKNLAKAQEDWKALQEDPGDPAAMIAPAPEMITQIRDTDAEIVKEAAGNANLAEELRVFTVVEYLLSAPKATTDFDQKDFSQQLGLMEEVVSNLAKWNNQGMDGTWLDNSFDDAERTNKTGPLGGVNAGLYINAPAGREGIKAIEDAAKHWQESLSKLEEVGAYRAELNRVTDFIEKARNSGIRVIFVNQSWDEYRATVADVTALFRDERQSRICYLGTQSSGTNVDLTFNVNTIAGSWDADGKPTANGRFDLQLPVFVSREEVTGAPRLPNALGVQHDRVPGANLLAYAASLVHRSGMGWKSETTAFESPLGFGGKSPNEHEDIPDFFRGLQLHDAATFETLLYQGLLNLVLLVKGHPDTRTVAVSVAQALRQCSPEDIAAAFSGLPGMPQGLSDIWCAQAGNTMAQLPLAGNQFPVAGALWKGQFSSPNGVSDPLGGGQRKECKAPGWLTLFGEL